MGRRPRILTLLVLLAFLLGASSHAVQVGAAPLPGAEASLSHDCDRHDHDGGGSHAVACSQTCGGLIAVLPPVATAPGGPKAAPPAMRARPLRPASMAPEPYPPKLLGRA